MNISVIIPTYKRPQTLLKTLESLQRQTSPDFEILVVDNAADQAVKEMVKNFGESASIPPRYIPESRTGVHYARNIAAEMAAGDLLLYTDDDVTFDSVWVNGYARAFETHPQMAAAGGPVRPDWEQPPPKWLLHFMKRRPDRFPILSLMEPFDSFQLDRKGYFFSCNMAIWKNILISSGGFHPEATGSQWIGDGETGLYHDLWKKRMLIGYVPDALVYHHIPPNRMTPEYFCHRLANEGASAEYTHFHKGISGMPHLLIRQFYLVFSLSAVCLGSTVWNLIRHDPCTRLKTWMYLHHYWSRMRYAARLLREPALRDLVLKKDWFNY